VPGPLSPGNPHLTGESPAQPGNPPSNRGIPCFKWRTTGEYPISPGNPPSNRGIPLYHGRTGGRVDGRTGSYHRALTAHCGVAYSLRWGSRLEGRYIRSATSDNILVAHPRHCNGGVEPVGMGVRIIRSSRVIYLPLSLPSCHKPQLHTGDVHFTGSIVEPLVSYSPRKWL
jgi:hypothetical protein